MPGYEIYVGGLNGHVEYYSTVTSTWTDITISGCTGNTVFDLKMMSDGTLWAGLTGNPPKLAYWNGSTWDVNSVTGLAAVTFFPAILPFSTTEVYIAAAGTGTSSKFVKWNGSSFSIIASFVGSSGAFAIDGIDNSHIYLSGADAVDYSTPFIWFWNGSALTRESAGVGLPTGTYLVYYVLAVLSNSNVILCSRPTSGTGKFYKGVFGSWSEDLDLSAYSRRPYAGTYALNRGRADRTTGRVQCWLEISTGGDGWWWERSAAGVWTEKTRIYNPVAYPLEGIEQPRFLCGMGNVICAVGQTVGSTKSDVLITEDYGTTWLCTDHSNTPLYSADIYYVTDPPYIISGPSGVQNDFVL